MDEFAQTRGAEDLFDDDFTPIAQPVIQQPEPQQHRPQRGKRTGSASRGRGNRAQDSFLRQTRPQPFVPTSTSITAAAESQKSAGTLVENAEYEATDTATLIESTKPDPRVSAEAEGEATILPFQGSLTLNPKSTNAVRGDRTATGGTPKPKLTEEELIARLAAAKLNSEKRAEAHRLAEADEASFQQREAHVSQKRKEEGQARRVMNMEREKNRLRKLDAKSGREWDEGKEEQDLKQDRGSQYSRGAHGGVAYEGGRGRGAAPINRVDQRQDGEHYWDSQHRRGTVDGYRGRGRGERGYRGRGDRGGRGNQSSNTNSNTHAVPPDSSKDFPALPGASEIFGPNQAPSSDTPFGPMAESSWADEVQAAKAPG